MTISVNTLELLIAAGLSGAELVAVVRSIEEDNGPSASAGAIRQKRWRDRQREQRNANNVTRNVTDGDAEPSPAPPSPNPPHTPQEPQPPHPHPGEPTRTRKDPTLLDPDWTPEPLKSGTVAFATVENWEPGRLERELSRFRDHHTAHGKRMVDWQAAWRTWIGNADEFGDRKRGNGSAGRPSAWAPGS